LKRNRDEFRPEKPPELVQRIVLPCLALFAKRTVPA
jgi:hypothetical protein